MNYNKKTNLLPGPNLAAWSVFVWGLLFFLYTHPDMIDRDNVVQSNTYSEIIYIRKGLYDLPWPRCGLGDIQFRQKRIFQLKRYSYQSFVSLFRIWARNGSIRSLRVTLERLKYNYHIKTDLNRFGYHPRCNQLSESIIKSK